VAGFPSSQRSHALTHAIDLAVVLACASVIFASAVSAANVYSAAKAWVVTNSDAKAKARIDIPCNFFIVEVK
jgi:hypothetical protein